MNYTLSVLIPARNEEYLSKTIEDVLANSSETTEIIVGLDGKWAMPEIKDNPRVTIVHVSESIGQRAMTNQLCRLSKAKWIMKLDAHCAMDKDFDSKMIADMHDDWTMAPTMRNLHIFNWVCPNGHIRYQGPSGSCKECQKETVKDVVWIPKTNPSSTSYCFDPEPHFQYFNEIKNRQSYKDQGDLTESMSLQGSCFMMTRDKYWELNICDEKTFGSWGSQGIEVACKTWLTGGKVMISHKTWYAHCFRTQGGDFGFPYEISGKQVETAKKKAKEIFFNEGFKGQVLPIKWLVEKFWPVPKWTNEDLIAIGGIPAIEAEVVKDKPTKGILYYTDNQLNMKIARTVRRQISKSGLPITSVSLKPMDFGHNICLPLERGYVTMVTQILTGLEAMKEDIVFFAEHDDLYNESYWNFTPKDKETWYYNGNYWMLRLPDGFAIRYNVSPLSGLCVYRESAIKHFRERLEYMKNQGDKLQMLHLGFEPFTHGRIDWKYKCKFELFQSDVPTIDISHGANVTKKRWTQAEFRRKPTFWEESQNFQIPKWDNVKRLLA